MPSVDFSQYYKYDELVAILHEYAEAYPQLVQLTSIGKSYEGRDLWLMMITNQATGPDVEKPAYWLDGNIHASEVTGSTAALHVIHRLLDDYESDATVRHLVDEQVFYVLPRFNPDGAEYSLTTPYPIRSSKRPYPFEEPQDGLYPEDIDGDGKILQMRIVDPAGEWRISEHDSRLMVRRQPHEIEGTFYRIFSEGIIRNWDGVNIKIAPAAYGLDINRNFPYEWQPEAQQRGAGPYPASEPEIRAVVDFISRHPNIHGAITYHTYSGAILRPFSNRSDEQVDTHDLTVYKKISDRGTELTGYPGVSVYHGFRYEPKEFIVGVFDDWVYDHFGIFGYTVELWDIVGEAGIKERDFIGWMKDHPEEDDLKILKWNDEQLDGAGYHTWRPFEHPQLGSVEIGGWETMYTWRNPPHKFLEETCRKNTEFVLAAAAAGPKLKIREFSATPLGEDLYRVRLVLINTGFLPTYGSKQAEKRKAVRPIRVELVLADDMTLEVGERRQDIGQLEGRSNKVMLWGGSVSNDNLTHVDWLVRAPNGGSVTVAALAQRAGTARGSVELTGK
ncbi:MAG TPA: M14 family metallopeptidase [Herpetosiphonaceae bacterium]